MDSQGLHSLSTGTLHSFARYGGTTYTCQCVLQQVRLSGKAEGVLQESLACITTVSAERPSIAPHSSWDGKALLPLGVERFFTLDGVTYGDTFVVAAESTKDGAEGLAHLQVCPTSGVVHFRAHAVPADCRRPCSLAGAVCSANSCELLRARRVRGCPRARALAQESGPTAPKLRECCRLTSSCD